jgi:hypothetical protein
VETPRQVRDWVRAQAAAHQEDSSFWGWYRTASRLDLGLAAAPLVALLLQVWQPLLQLVRFAADMIAIATLPPLLRCHLDLL